MMENTTNVVECGWKKYSYTSEIIMWARKKNIEMILEGRINNKQKIFCFDGYLDGTVCKQRIKEDSTPVK